MSRLSSEQSDVSADSLFHDISDNLEEHKSIPDPPMNQRLHNNSPNNKSPNTEIETDFLTILSKLRLKNINRIIFAHININSIRNKFHLLTSNLNGKIDILMISETKLDNSFPKSEFIIPGYTEPYRMDRNRHGGGILLYIAKK